MFFIVFGDLHKFEIIFFFPKKASCINLRSNYKLYNPIRALYILIKIFKFKGMALGHWNKSENDLYLQFQ